MADIFRGSGRWGPTIGSIEGETVYKGSGYVRSIVGHIRGDAVVAGGRYEASTTARLAKTMVPLFGQAWGVFVDRYGTDEMVGFGWSGGIYEAGGVIGMGDQVGGGTDSTSAKSLAAAGFLLSLFDEDGALSGRGHGSDGRIPEPLGRTGGPSCRSRPLWE